MRNLVVGDVLSLEAGDIIPADVQLIESRDLFISQAALSGEALPVEKYDTMGAVSAKDAKESNELVKGSGDTNAHGGDVLDLSNVCFMGTNVISGRASAVVVATGTKTYLGSLAKNFVTRKRVESSFDRGVSSVSMLLIRFMLDMVPVVFLINGLTKGDWVTAFTFSVAVAVGLTPEVLPMVVSANLARGAVAMSQAKVVVKRLNSVRNLGAMDVLCTDKTGTLTQDKVILQRYLNAQGQADDGVLSLAWLNSFYQSGQKNLMDIAIVRYADNKGGAVKPATYTKIDELPFDFVRRRLSVVLASLNQQHLMISKGAVEEIMAVSSYVMDDGVVYPLDDERRASLLQYAVALNQDGFRVLLIATRVIPDDQRRVQYGVQDEENLVVYGFLGFLDPPKESAAPAIRALQDYGVTVKVLTGDNAIVTARVCRDVGLDASTLLWGWQIAELILPKKPLILSCWKKVYWCCKRG